MLPAPGHTPDELRQWIEKVLERTAWSPSKLAAEAGLAPSTLNRFIAGGNYVLSNTSVARLEAAAIRRIRERVAAGDLQPPAGQAEPYLPDHKIVLVPEIDPRDAMNTRSQWGFPENWFRFTFSADAGDCDVVPIEDDGMAPDLRPGDRVVIDRRQADPSMPGMFIIETAAGMVARRLEALPHEDGLIRVQPRNPDFLTHEISRSSMNIRGRIIGMWRRL